MAIKATIESKTPHFFNELSDWELIRAINDPTTFSEAFTEFYNRYKNFLLKVCRKCCSHFDSSDLLADDIFQNTFIKVAGKSKTFKLNNDKAKENISNEIKAWLAKIAKNELINFLRKNPDEVALSNPFRIRSYDLHEEIIYDTHEEETITEKEPTIQKSALDKGLSILTDRERYILMAYMQYFDFKSPLRHLPDDIIKSLCEKFFIKPDNIRQIKSRALKKLKDNIYSRNL